MVNFESVLASIALHTLPFPFTVSVLPQIFILFALSVAPNVLPFSASVTLPVTFISCAISLSAISLYSVIVAVPASLALSKASQISPTSSVFSLPPSV